MISERWHIAAPFLQWLGKKEIPAPLMANNCAQRGNGGGRSYYIIGNSAQLSQDPRLAGGLFLKAWEDIPKNNFWRRHQDHKSSCGKKLRKSKLLSSSFFTSATPTVSVSNFCECPCGHFDLVVLVVQRHLDGENRTISNLAQTQHSVMPQILNNRSNFHLHLVFISVATSGKISSQHGRE